MKQAGGGATFTETTDGIRRRLGGTVLPGAAAHREMAPEYRTDLSQFTVERRRCAEAAVLVLLVPVNSASLVLTVRRHDLRHHGGQISFPGGRREAGETLLQTALRECTEEIGVDPSTVDVLGAMTPLFIPPTGFCVYPFVGRTDATQFRLDPREVDRILTVPVAELAEPSLRATHTRRLRDRDFVVPHFAIGGEIVWGATAMMLAEFAIIAGRATIAGSS